MDYTFTDVEFMSASEKQRVIKSWVRFLKSDCKFTQFSKVLYNHLIQHCSFIAHYNRAGFYATYFDSDAQAKHQFFSQFDGRGPCMSTEYGYDGWKTSPEYRDINEAMIAEAAPFIDKITQAADAKQKEWQRLVRSSRNTASQLNGLE